MRFIWIVLVTGFFAVGSILSDARAGDRKPNIIIIMADDMGYEGLHCFGSDRFQTPHLDRLAEQGMRLTDFHSSGAVCSPTRAGLLTGRYQQRTGITAVINAQPKHPTHHLGLPANERTFAELLKPAGYATAIFGKWHLGYTPSYNPVHQGFDEFRGFVSGNVDYQSHYDQAGAYDWWDGVKKIEEPGYTTRLITRHALRFIEDHKDQPFCLYLAHAAIHYPNQGPDDPPVRGPHARPAVELSPTFEAVQAMTRALDDSVGAVYRKVRELGLAQDTFILFFSDNGGTRDNRSTGDRLRGLKGSVYEGGHRVPAIAWWPGRIPPGTRSDALTISLDVFPTIAEVAGVALPEDRVIDGRSLLPVLTQGAVIAERKLFWQYGRKLAMRDGPWKLVEVGGGKGRPQLFHLSRDLGERSDLATAEPDRVKAMRAELESWRREVSAPGATVSAP